MPNASSWSGVTISIDPSTSIGRSKSINSPFNLPAKAFFARELLMLFAISNVDEPLSNSLTAPSGKVILIILSSPFNFLNKKSPSKSY